MTPKKLNPAARGAGRAPECRLLASFDTPENTTTSSLHAMRVAHLARRYALPPRAAGLLASLVFSNTEAAR